MSTSSEDVPMTPPTTSTEVRSNLLQALRMDVVGADPASPHFDRYKDEKLIQAPSKWYLTGFLAPYGAAQDIRLQAAITLIKSV